MYGDICAWANWSFTPFGVEVTGALGPKATSLCKRLCRALSMQDGTPIGQVAAHVAGRISYALAKGRGEMLVAALPRDHPW